MTSKELRIGNYIKTPEQEERVYDNFFDTDEGVRFINDWNISVIKPIQLTEEWLLRMGFDNWGKGKLYTNEYETYDRFVLHNVLGGTSNFEVHYIKSTYDNTEHYQYIISCDEDERINWGEEIKHVHQLQNLYFALTGKELEIK